MQEQGDREKVDEREEKEEDEPAGEEADIVASPLLLPAHSPLLEGAAVAVDVGVMQVRSSCI